MAGTTLGGTFGTRVVIDPQALATLLRSDQGPVVRQLIKAGDVVKEGAQRRVHVWAPAVGEPEWSVRRRVKKRKPGTLRDSIVKRVVEGGPSGVMVLVGSEDPIAVYHHEGTVPHSIAAATKPMLVYWDGKRGTTVRTESVQHPGTNPNRYLVDALADVRGMF